MGILEDYVAPIYSMLEAEYDRISNGVPSLFVMCTQAMPTETKKKQEYFILLLDETVWEEQYWVT